MGRIGIFRCVRSYQWISEKFIILAPDKWKKMQMYKYICAFFLHLIIRSVNVDQSFMGLVWKPDMYIWDLNGEVVMIIYHFDNIDYYILDNGDIN